MSYDTNYYKKYEPLFGHWYIADEIGKGSFGQVYLIQREEMGKTYQAAMKVISVPDNKNEVKELYYDGMTKQDTSVYYESVVKDLVKEVELMADLKGNSNIVSYEDHICIQHDDGVGYDILIRMELLKPLFGDKKLTTNDIVELGIDICRALEICAKHNIIHRDIKPENIFISPNGDYKIGDFGVARIMEETNSGLSQKGTFTYMAPEIYRGDDYGPTVDIYSLGIVMYRLLNNRPPFIPSNTRSITATDKNDALMRRMKGEQIPALNGVDAELSDIILKACEFKLEDRYASATEFKVVLEDYKRKLDDSDIAIAVETVIEDEPTDKSAWLPDDEGETVIIQNPIDEVEDSGPTVIMEDDPAEGTEIIKLDPPEKSSPKKPTGDGNKRNKGILIGVIAGVLAAAAVAVLVLMPRPVTDIKGMESSFNMTEGDSYEIVCEAVTKSVIKPEVSFESDNPDVVIYDRGHLNALKPGKVNLLLKAKNYTEVVVVTVTAKVTSIEGVDDVEIHVGDSEQLKPVPQPEEAATTEDCSYEIEDMKIADISSSGKLTGKSEGETKLTIYCGGCSKLINVKVAEKAAPKVYYSSPKPKKSKPKKASKADKGTWD